MIPSPQTGRHTEGEVEVPPEQVQPATGPEQSDLHLSASEVFPSSQVSP